MMTEIRGASNAKASASSDGSRAIRPRVRGSRRELGSSMSTTSPSRIATRSCISCYAGAHPSRSTVSSSTRPRGPFVFVRPGVKRTAFGDEPDTTIIAVCGVPGKPYEPGGWELFAPLRPLYEAGDYAEAADRGRELLAGDPPYVDLFYNIACCESLADQNGQAIAHPSARDRTLGADPPVP